MAYTQTLSLKVTPKTLNSYACGTRRKYWNTILKIVAVGPDGIRLTAWPSHGIGEVIISPRNVAMVFKPTAIHRNDYSTLGSFSR